jgi:hypothetical protein
VLGGSSTYQPAAVAAPYTKLAREARSHGPAVLEEASSAAHVREEAGALRKPAPRSLAALA